jgi:DNA-directed RNA polymerase specialized sigma24 family protein
MIWRDGGATADGEIDPERELELRLVAQVHAGAAWALSSLVARYQPPVVRYLIRLTGDTEKAHAAAEQVFVRMARRLRGPQRGEQLRLWLLRTSTDLGLEVLRQPLGAAPGQLAGPKAPPALPPAKRRPGAVSRMVRAFGSRSRNTPRPVPPTQEFVWGDAAGDADGFSHVTETLSPREQVRHRLIRAVLAELSYSDAQCLALHLVAGLNQTEVALALGVVAPVARRRIVQGLQLFGRRYEATLASLGLPKDFADADVANVQFTPAGAMIAHTVVPDETQVDEGETAEEVALRREREVTGTLVVPTEILPALEELLANEPDGQAPSSMDTAAVMSSDEDAVALRGPLDPQAAASVYFTENMAAELTQTHTDSSQDVPEPLGVAADVVPDLETVVAPQGPQTERPDQRLEFAPDEAPSFEEVEVQLADESAVATEAAQPVGVQASELVEHSAPPRTVPVLSPTERAASAARLTPPIADLSVSRGGEKTEDDELLIEWGSNPQIPIHMRPDLNAAISQPEAPAPSPAQDENDWLLVLEEERDEANVASLESRWRRILSADGEAEDPDESMW